ncbi:MAG: AAA family ATPase [Alphaproteobacteria bacterium]|nr:AAA family ATPase [Alphaproteobacteria bacterium]
MKIIEKVEIYRFRSIGNETIKTEDITVFSGKNNSGKSNILKALNLFFNSQTQLDEAYNYLRDYNKCYTGSSGGKRDVRITIHFKPTGKAALSKPFKVERVFSANSDAPITTYYSSNPEINKRIEKNDGNVIRQFSLFLGKIKFLYIPAIRDRKFVQNLFKKFEDLIQRDTKRSQEFSTAVSSLSDILEQKSKDISMDFSKFINLPTRASLSSNIDDLLNSVHINVETQIKKPEKRRSKNIKNVEVDLMSSGDGILMSYIAYFIAHLSKKAKQNFIWGFEEPENSLEYSKAQALAGDFYNKFRSHAQIFITTHSPCFIFLKEKNSVQFYRVYLDIKGDKQLTKIKTIQEIQRLLFNTPEYEKLAEELSFVEQAQDVEKLTRSFWEERKELEKEQEEYIRKIKEFQDKSKCIIATEGKFDKILLETAWEKLYATQCPYNFIESEGAPDLNRKLRNTIPNSVIIIGLFDSDHEGIGQANGLGFQKEKDFYVKKKDGYANIYALTLPVPEHKIQYKRRKKFEIENYFSDDVLRSLSDLSYEVCLDEKGKFIVRDGQVQTIELLTIRDAQKRNLATEIAPKLPENEFLEFKILFDKLDEIVKHKK